MNAHIVARGWGTDQILDRFARYLADGTGWSVGAHPEKSAAVNVYMPYLVMEDDPGFRSGKLVAWFTHRETAWPAKALMWDNAQRDAHLRLACAKMYVDQLAKHGPAVQVAAPLERDKFVIRNKLVRHGKPRVGFSGYIYRTGRKGEKMVAQLMKDHGHEWDIIASGKGWPCHCGEYTWHDVQTFYQSLDVFVCSSTIEGLPMPPLEALSCGVKVVIPTNVGLLDEIPPAAGIVRYERGDYEQMVQSIQMALDTAANAQELRDAMAAYSVAAFCADFEGAVNAMA